MGILHTPEGKERAQRRLAAALRDGKIGTGRFFNFRAREGRTAVDVFGHLYMEFEEEIEHADSWLEALGLDVYGDDFSIIRKLNDAEKFDKAILWAISL